MILQWTLTGCMLLTVLALGIHQLVLVLKTRDLREQLAQCREALDNQRNLAAAVLRDLQAAKSALRAERQAHRRIRHRFWLLEELVAATQPGITARRRMLTDQRTAQAHSL